MAGIELAWLPKQSDWASKIQVDEKAGFASWERLVELAKSRLDFLQTDRLDRLSQRSFPEPPAGLTTKPVRLAVLGSSTTRHLLGAIRSAALRRDMWVATHEGEYGQYMQALLGGDAALDLFAPTAVLIALDARHLTADLAVGATESEADDVIAATVERLEGCWRAARDRYGAVVIQQTVLPTVMPLLGENEDRLFGSPLRMVHRLNAILRSRADAAGIHLLSVDERAAQDGIRLWHDTVLWHRAKQEVSPAAAPVYGDLVARLLAAIQGRSSKCLVLDLDNTLWGGVVGDDGVENLILGQGSALGEAFAGVQRYAKQLSQRGIILAVCSKNDETIALQAFEHHPEMILKRADIAAFVANWDDKGQNLRRIAQTLNIGLDALVFVDDNPFERALVRSAVPQVFVPEIPDDEPALVPQIVSDSGAFEGLRVTADDLRRGEQYQQNKERLTAQATASDLPTYLRSLEMTLTWRRFDRPGLARIVQLVNKTNQFNLTTRRITEDQVLAIMGDEKAFGLQIRLVDRFGDNGIISIVIGRMIDGHDCLIDTWLMSCRVLGRQVEQAVLGLCVAEARRLGAHRLIGEFIPTGKNDMVRDHYARLGFAPLDDGSRFALPLAEFRDFAVPMQVFMGE